MNRSSLATLLVVLTGIAVALAFWLYPGKDRRFRRTALTHREVATRVLAENAAARWPDARVLVISNPFSQQKGHPRAIYEYEESGLKGLRAGFGDAVPLTVAFPTLRPEFQQNPAAVYVDPQTTTPLSYLVAQQAFDRLAEEHPDCSLLVSLIGLPVNASEMSIWQQTDGPQFALLLPDWRTLGDREAVRAAVTSGKIVAAVLNKPGAPAEDAPVDQDYQAEFKQRFLLLTAETIDTLMQQYPQLFP